MKSGALEINVTSCPIFQEFTSTDPVDVNFTRTDQGLNGERKIEELNFKSTTKRLPRRIGEHFPHLLALICFKRGLMSIDRSDFSGLNKLRVLRLSGNQIQSLSDDVFHEASSLEIIFLDNNRIETAKKVIFIAPQLPNMRFVDLAGNPIIHNNARQLADLLSHFNEKNYKRCQNVSSMSDYDEVAEQPRNKTTEVPKPEPRNDTTEVQKPDLPNPFIEYLLYALIYVTADLTLSVILLCTKLFCRR